MARIARVIVPDIPHQITQRGNRKTMTLDTGAVISYTYDVIYQLTNEERTGSTPYALSWIYDKVGNRLTQDKWDGSITTTTTSTYNDANQLIESVEGGITTTGYTYDANWRAGHIQPAGMGYSSMMQRIVSVK